MAKNFFCLNFWRMLVPLSHQSPGRGKIVFQLHIRALILRCYWLCQWRLPMQVGYGSACREKDQEWCRRGAISQEERMEDT